MQQKYTKSNIQDSDLTKWLATEWVVVQIWKQLHWPTSLLSSHRHHCFTIHTLLLLLLLLNEGD